MKDAFEYKGYWWLPDKENIKLPGTLSYSQEHGAHLEIVGVFGTERSARIEQPTIILGTIQQGKPITLYNCMYSSWTFPLIGLGGGKYRVHVIFEGVHFVSEEKIKFHQLCGSYTDLAAWVDLYGFTIDLETEGGIVSKIRYEMPQSQFFDISDSREAGIVFSSEGPNWSRVQTEVTISQQTYLTIKSRTGDVAFDAMFAQLNAFSYLLQVAAQRVPYPISVYGFSEENIQKLDGQEPHYPDIDIYYEPIEPMASRSQRLPNEMLFIYKDLEQKQIGAWFQTFEKFQTVIHLYRSLFFSDRLFIDTRFLNMAQALESLHSILFGNEYLPHEEFMKQKERALKTIPEDLVEWVGTALESANNKRFRQKIWELLKNKEKILGECIGDTDLFAKRVRDTRNEFVHHNKLRWTFENGKELVNAIEVMKMLFETYLLEIIGFSSEKVQELMTPKIASHLTGWRHLRSIKV